jgi:hypothetical protein
MLSVRIPVFAKNGTDVRSPSVPIFAVFPLSRHAGLDPGSTSFERGENGITYRRSNTG